MVEDMIENVETDTIKKVSDNFSKVISSLGDYLISIGNVEKENPDFKVFIDKMKSEPSYFNFLIKEMPPEIGKDLLFIFISMINLQDKAKDMDKLNPDEKIKLGEELKKVGESFKKLYEALDKIKTEAKK